MRIRCLPSVSILLFALAQAPCLVQAATAEQPAADCVSAARIAERRWQLPQGILAAIGEVESGRLDEATGRRQPWPWTIDVAGQGYVFRDASEAVNVVTFLRGRGIDSIDVGCFQVNLHYHPTAFDSLPTAFEPLANGDYAGALLRSLYERTGSWVAAIADYHSAAPLEGDWYRARVLRAWFARPPERQAEAGDAIPVYTPLTLPAAWRGRLLPAVGVPAR